MLFTLTVAANVTLRAIFIAAITMIIVLLEKFRLRVRIVRMGIQVWGRWQEGDEEELAQISTKVASLGTSFAIMSTQLVGVALAITGKAYLHWWTAEVEPVEC